MSIGTNSIGLNDSHEIQRRNNERAGRWIAEKIGEHLAWKWTGGVTGMRRHTEDDGGKFVAVTWPEMLEEMLRQRFIQKVEIVRRDEDEHPDADDGYRVTVYGEHTPHPAVSWRVTLAAALSNCIVAIVCEYLEAEDARRDAKEARP